MQNNQHGTKPAQINSLPNNQDDHLTINLTVNSNSLTSDTPYEGHTSKNLRTLTIYSFQKYPIYPRERTEPHGSKPHYKVSNNSNTKISHGGKKWSLQRHGWIIQQRQRGCWIFRRKKYSNQNFNEVKFSN